MNKGVNKVILLGNVGKEPTINKGVVSFSIATSSSWKDKNTNETKEKTEWTKVVLFNKLAEIGEKYIKKGSKLYVEGSLSTRKWQDKEGRDQYTTEVVANSFQLLDKKEEKLDSIDLGDVPF